MLKLEDLDAMEDRARLLLERDRPSEQEPLMRLAQDFFRLTAEVQALLKKTTRSGEGFVLGDFSGRGGEMHVEQIRWLEERLRKLASSDGAVVESEIRANALRLSVEQELAGFKPQAPGPPFRPPLDSVNHPSHYTAHPSGVECVDVVEHMPFNLGSAVKYLWRAGLKNEDPTEDLEKAVWYVRREIERRKNARR